MVWTKSAEKIFSAALSSFSGEKGKFFVSSRMPFGVCRHWQNKTQSPPNEWGVGASQAWKHHNVFHSFISAPTPFASYHYTHKYIHHGKNLYCQLGNWCITLSTRYRSASTSLTQNWDKFYSEQKSYECGLNLNFVIVGEVTSQIIPHRRTFV